MYGNGGGWDNSREIRFSGKLPERNPGSHNNLVGPTRGIPEKNHLRYRENGAYFDNNGVVLHGNEPEKSLPEK